MSSPLDVSKARSHFPVLETGYIFADNAGGSQCAKDVVDRISDYLLNTNVQLGADYSVSVTSTNRVLSEAPASACKLINARSPDEIVFGPSSTMNLENLARGMESGVEAGDEFIVTGEHEANVGVWKKLAARRGAILKHWKATTTDPANPYSVSLKIEELLPLISSKTRIIAFTACSNILGSVVPVKEVIKAARAEAQSKGAKKVEISVDCVAYAPHRLIDVQDWDVDFCVFSVYKVYGPHTSILYVRSAALELSISSIAHHFLKVDAKPYKIQPGGPGYELVYGTTGVVHYLESLTPKSTLQASFEAIAIHEQELLKVLMGFLTHPDQKARGIRIVGEETVTLERVPTVSFVVVGQRPIKSREIVSAFDRKGGVGIRYGHFYAYTLVTDLSPSLDPDDGVVRISLVHYNTIEEVERIVEILKEVLA
ncbi:hypothetical protein AX17_006973 [Amanita inopinata Kibby_2008]|nr:hypothetical protein AX17_006973 [Amanita inopinata Kibby_2008]